MWYRGQGTSAIGCVRRAGPPAPLNSHLPMCKTELTPVPPSFMDFHHNQRGWCTRQHGRNESPHISQPTAPYLGPLKKTGEFRNWVLYKLERWYGTCTTCTVHHAVLITKMHKYEHWMEFEKIITNTYVDFGLKESCPSFLIAKWREWIIVFLYKALPSIIRQVPAGSVGHQRYSFCTHYEQNTLHSIFKV